MATTGPCHSDQDRGHAFWRHVWLLAHALSEIEALLTRLDELVPELLGQPCEPP